MMIPIREQLLDYSYGIDLKDSIRRPDGLQSLRELKRLRSNAVYN
jgi:hypothetical protein